MSSFDAKVRLETVRLKQIKTATDAFKDADVASVSKAQVNTRLELLDATWTKFDADHERVCDSRAEQAMESKYFVDDYYSQGYEAYANNRAALLDLLERVTAASAQDGAILADQSAMGLSSGYARRSLPKISLPQFFGSFQEWRPFHDLFTSMVGSSSDLTAVEKMHYLKSCLRGEAAQLISNFTVSGENFVLAWDKLTFRYENKRLLINKHLDTIFRIKPLQFKSAAALNHLMATIRESLDALKALGSPTNHWDHIISYIIIHRLDPETHEAWEIEQGACTTPAPLSELESFVEGRIRALESVEERKAPKSRSSTTSRSVERSSSSHHAAASNPSKACSFCSAAHYIASCDSFKKKSLDERLNFIKHQNLCFNCLGFHLLAHCRSSRRCLNCNGHHHTLLHGSQNRNPSPSVTAAGSSFPSQAAVNHSSSSPAVQAYPRALLATARVLVLGPRGTQVEARALIDPGSEVSLISESLTQHLQLPRSKSHLRITGIQGKHVSTSQFRVSFTIQSLRDSRYQYDLCAHTLQKITNITPPLSLDVAQWQHLKDLTLADPSCLTPGSIDLLLGSGFHSEILLPGLIRGAPNTPIAQNTTLGWVISGSVLSNTHAAVSLHCAVEPSIDDLLQNFWKQEEIQSVDSRVWTSPESECEEHFRTTHSRDSSGRFVVRLPFRQSPSLLGDSGRTAHRLFHILKRKLQRSAEYCELYNEFLREYEVLGHMRPAPNPTNLHSPIYFLPHHGVFRETSVTTKLRVVFNGSSRTSSGYSLNDLLHTGPKLQTDLFDVLLWFRRFRYAFASDIEKMYRQVNVDPQDWDYQSILWSKDGGLPRRFQLTTVTYGLACAPYLALRALNQLIVDEGHHFPSAVPVLTQGRYVDDVFGGADTITECRDVIRQVDQLCSRGCFPLQKWISNEHQTLNSLELSRLSPPGSLVIDDHVVTHTLGLLWAPDIDCFKVSLNLNDNSPAIKRRVLSQIAQIYDPLGFLAPFVITAKIFMQQLWLSKVDWDEQLPSSLRTSWAGFLSQLPELQQISIPRHLGLSSKLKHIQLHGFCDASQFAMGAVVFLRLACNSGQINTHLICAKTKVAPLKQITIPRLELSAAVLLTRLMKSVVQSMSFSEAPLWLWTDSRVTLTWVTSHPSRWKEYVRNRVSFIQDSLPNAKWRFVPGRENPADCASRGIPPRELIGHKLWWSGPHWLSLGSTSWPSVEFSQPKTSALAVNREARSAPVLLTGPESDPEPELLTRFSSLSKLIRVTAWILRILPHSTTDEPPTSSLTPVEINNSLCRWIRLAQSSAFSREILSISRNDRQGVPPYMRSLNPFLDSNGLLRVGGRLRNAEIPYDTKHPYILPRDSTLSKLIIHDAHSRSLHGGTTLTLSTTRERFWIIGGRNSVRSHILHCVICARYRAQHASQLMGQLPSTRVQPSRPFLHSGVDYAGPFLCKTWHGRAAKSYKCYIALFVCLSTSALHLELVTKYTSAAFIAAYKRFTGRRGVCATLSSDCGSNFVGSDAELKLLLAKSTEENKNLQYQLNSMGTVWKFIPPSSPHFGGLWEAGVKSVKFHLRRTISESRLTYEEFSTLLVQIESVLNSRPICRLTDDPDDIAPLTPGHFLIGSLLTSIPEPSTLTTPVNRLSRWQFITRLRDQFWTQWSRNCLQQMQAIYKWQYPTASIKQGTIVLVTDERLPPGQWPLATVTEIHPGKDNHTRVVTLKTSKGTFKRPVTKLCVLPIDPDTNFKPNT